MGFRNMQEKLELLITHESGRFLWSAEHIIMCFESLSDEKLLAEKKKRDLENLK